jgi:tripartite-type tricarboxylate transporter receptor subunit TctC
MNYRSIIGAALAVSTSMLLLVANAADGDYPNKPITIIYPYAAGSASDTMTRQFAEVISKALGQPVLHARPVRERNDGGESLLVQPSIQANR